MVWYNPGTWFDSGPAFTATGDQNDPLGKHALLDGYVPNAEMDAQEAYRQQAMGRGQWGSSGVANGGGKYSRTSWAHDYNAQDPLEANAERAAERRGNYNYGGDPNAAQNLNRRIDNVNSGYGQQFADFGAGAQQNQAAAMGRTPVSGADTARSQAAYGGLMNMARGPEGPSAAQAQLQQGTNQAMASQLALARSGRGMGESASAMRNAQMQGAGIAANQANQSAMLRANESQAYRGQQMQAYNAAGGLAQGMTGAGLQGRALNDQTGLAYGQQNLAATQAGQQGANQGFGLQNTVNVGQLQGNMGYEQGLNGIYATNMGKPQEAGSTPDWMPYMQAGVAAASLFSDERVKTNVEKTDGKGALQAILATTPSEWDYREPEKHGAGRQFGQMAQDWERTPLGKTVVNHAPDGTKMVDTRRIAVLNTAAIGELARQVKALGGRE